MGNNIDRYSDWFIAEFAPVAIVITLALVFQQSFENHSKGNDVLIKIHLTPNTALSCNNKKKYI